LKAAVYGACAIVVGVLAGSAYLFRSSLLPTTSPPPVVAQAPKSDLPPGAILIPAGDGVCRMHALDNTTGQIMDYGVVKCSHASEQNLAAWMRATNKDKFVEIGKSFRHEGDPQ
jgi:hypothetical protein